MVYLMHPVDQVQPVLVTADDSVEALVEGLDALGLLADETVDGEWFADDRTIVADGARLRRALDAYRALAAAGGVRRALAEARCDPGAFNALEEFFAFAADADGQDLLVQHLT